MSEAYFHVWHISLKPLHLTLTNIKDAHSLKLIRIMTFPAAALQYIRSLLKERASYIAVFTIPHHTSDFPSHGLSHETCTGLSASSSAPILYFQGFLMRGIDPSQLFHVKSNFSKHAVAPWLSIKDAKNFVAHTVHTSLISLTLFNRQPAEGTIFWCYIFGLRVRTRAMAATTLELRTLDQETSAVHMGTLIWRKLRWERWTASLKSNFSHTTL